MSEAPRTGLNGLGWVGIVALALGLGFIGVVVITFVFPFGLLLAPVIAFAASAVLVLLAASSADERRHGREESPGVGRRLAVSLPFTVLTLAVVAAGAAHIAVWNPLAKVPGLELDELYRALDRVGETPNWGFVIGWGAVWSLAALALPVVAVTARRVRAASDRVIAVLGLLLAAGAALSTWIAGFNHGMSIADAFMTSGGDAAASGVLILGFGLAAGVVAVVLAVVPLLGRARRRRAA